MEAPRTAIVTLMDIHGISSLVSFSSHLSLVATRKIVAQISKEEQTALTKMGRAMPTAVPTLTEMIATYSSLLSPLYLEY